MQNPPCMRTCIPFSLTVVFILLPCCTPVVKEYRDLKSKNYQKYYVSGQQPVYHGDSLITISFPVGGMGEGYILFGGRGNIQAFHPGSGGPPEDPLQAFFGIWAKEGSEFNSVEDVEFEPVVRLLERRIPAEQSGYPSEIPYLAGIPRLRQGSFKGQFPFGTWQLKDRDLPVQAEMEAYNPFIPLDQASSSLPACLVRWKLTNPLQKSVEVSLAFGISSALSEGIKVEEISMESYRGMKLSGTENDQELVVVTSPDAGIQTHAQPQIFWQDFADDGHLEPLGIQDVNGFVSPVIHSLFLKTTLPPGGEAVIPMIFSWTSLNRQDLPDAASMAVNIIREMDYLYTNSRAFSDVINQSSYPDYLIHTLGGDIVQLKHAGEVQSGIHAEMAGRFFPGDDTVPWEYLSKGMTGHQDDPEIPLMNILQVYLNWKLTGETAGLKRHWDVLTRQMEQIQDMMPQGDMISGSLYLAALKACCAMAVQLQATEKAEQYLRSFDESVTLYEDKCWNGEYFIQSAGSEQEEDLQIGTGCHSDQLLGQCLAWSSGMDSLLSPVLMKRAMLSVFRYNFSKNLSKHINAGRGNVVNDEGGLLTCTWPHGNRPFIPVPYADEVWTGIEYTTAANMIYCGMVDEGLEMIRISEDRFRGYNRNPWSIHPEGFCSQRPAWHLHLALSGYRFDAAEKSMTFHPKINQSQFTCFWSTDKGWGRAKISANSISIEVLFGELDIDRITVPANYGYRDVDQISHGKASLNAGREYIHIHLTGSMPLACGTKLSMKLRQ
jgi:non-lysosomal glucosylceramidase